MKLERIVLRRNTVGDMTRRLEVDFINMRVREADWLKDNPSSAWQNWQDVTRAEAVSAIKLFRYGGTFEQRMSAVECSAFYEGELAFSGSLSHIFGE